MHSKKLNLELINLNVLYKTSDRYCFPGNWLRLNSTQKMIHSLASALGCEVGDLVIRRGRGASSTCWVHPDLGDILPH